jgi:hypothetical protein
MKKIIIYNTFSYDCVFLLAAAKKAGYLPISASSPSSLWNSDVEEIILCNIEPDKISSSPQYHPDIEIYLKGKIKFISGFLFTPFREWDKKNLRLNRIMSFYTAQMRKNDDDMRSGEWQYNEEVIMYARALKTAMVIGLNTDWSIYESLMHKVVLEISGQIPSSLIEVYSEVYDRVLETTKKAIGKLEVNSLVQMPKRKIAFAYLDNVSDYLDFLDLRQACLDKYPYLSVIQYRSYGQEYTWLISNEMLDVSQFFKLESNNKYEALILAPHKAVLRHLNEVIAELRFN